MQQAGLAHSTLAGWEEGARIPRIDAVEKVAYALSLSPVYLAFGIEGEAGPLANGLRCDGMAQRLTAERTARGLSVRALARLAGLTDTAVRSTESGASVPSIATAEALAKALALSPGWLAFGVGQRELPLRRQSRQAAHSSADA